MLDFLRKDTASVSLMFGFVVSSAATLYKIFRLQSSGEIVARYILISSTEAETYDT